MSREDKLIENGGMCSACGNKEKLSDLKEKGYISCCPKRRIVIVCDVN